MNKALTELVDLIGFSASLHLVRAFGGRLLYIPRHPKEDHPITLAVGWDAACKLSEVHGSLPLTVPSERTALAEQRKRAVCEAYQEGQSVLSIAHTYGISRCWVNRILEQGGVVRTTAVDSRQRGLFD